MAGRRAGVAGEQVVLDRVGRRGTRKTVQDHRTKSSARHKNRCEVVGRERPGVGAQVAHATRVTRPGAGAREPGVHAPCAICARGPAHGRFLLAAGASRLAASRSSVLAASPSPRPLGSEPHGCFLLAVGASRAAVLNLDPTPKAAAPGLAAPPKAAAPGLAMAPLALRSGLRRPRRPLRSRSLRQDPPCPLKSAAVAQVPWRHRTPGPAAATAARHGRRRASAGRRRPAPRLRW